MTVTYRGDHPEVIEVDFESVESAVEFTTWLATHPRFALVPEGTSVEVLCSLGMVEFVNDIPVLKVS